MERYSRNRIYVSDEEQRKVQQTRILLGGAGIGSIIAECALRFGFEKITIIDGDKVDLSNLNRQNYFRTDIGKYKAETLCKRLKKINPNAKVSFINSYFDHENIHDIIHGYDIAVNALDFKNDIPFLFDKLCSEQNTPVLHPYNFGWAGFLTVIKPDGCKITELSKEPQGFELTMANYVANHYAFWHHKDLWLKDIIYKYTHEKENLPPPQLSIASWLVAGLSVNVMYNIATGKEIIYFPKYYLSSIMND